MASITAPFSLLSMFAMYSAEKSDITLEWMNGGLLGSIGEKALHQGT